jgi:hypothetical protein
VHRTILGPVYGNENPGYFYKFQKPLQTETFGSKKRASPGNRCTGTLRGRSPWERNQKVPKSHILYGVYYITFYPVTDSNAVKFIE